jgi:tetratricopeptide (TPR) repeat protein
MQSSSLSYAWRSGETLVARGDATKALAGVQSEPDDHARRWCTALAYQALGRKADADAALASAEQKDADDSPYAIARTHAYRGEFDLAFSWLDRAFRQRDFYLTNVKVEPLLQPLKRDPRYSTLLRKLQLPE